MEQSINMKPLLCPMSWVHERLERIASSHQTNVSRNRAGRFDDRPLTNLCHLIIIFFRSRVINLVWCTPARTKTPQRFIGFSSGSIHSTYCLNGSSFSAYITFCFASTLNKKTVPTQTPFHRFHLPLPTQNCFRLFICSKTIHHKNASRSLHLGILTSDVLSILGTTPSCCFEVTNRIPKFYSRYFQTGITSAVPAFLSKVVQQSAWCVWGFAVKQCK